MLKILVLSLFSLASLAGGTVVKDVKTYEQAAQEACLGQAIGAQCTISFQGGSVSVGICMQVPGSPNLQLSCQIDTQNLPGCAKKVAAAHAANQSLKK
jgi:hypothetical protein